MPVPVVPLPRSPYTQICVSLRRITRGCMPRVNIPLPSPSPPRPSVIPLNGMRRTVVVPLVRNELVIVRRLLSHNYPFFERSRRVPSVSRERVALFPFSPPPQRIERTQVARSRPGSASLSGAWRVPAASSRAGVTGVKGNPAWLRSADKKFLGESAARRTPRGEIYRTAGTERTSGARADVAFFPLRSLADAHFSPLSHLSFPAAS